MTMMNWIELALLITILVVGTIIKIYTKKKVDDLEGSIGVVKKSDCKGSMLNAERKIK